MNLHDLIAVSGDSRLLDYMFCNGELRISLDVEQLDLIAQIHVRTDAVLGTRDFTHNLAVQTCSVKLITLTALQSRNGIFIPSSDFANMMKEIKTGLFLAYGKKSTGTNWVLSFQGVELLLGCYISDIESVSIQTG